MKWLLAALAIMLFSASSALAQRTYTSPVNYCRAVGTINQPDSRYIGPKLPAWMARQLNLQPNQGNRMEWRCMNGAVWACVYGANIPCNSPANTSQVPTAAITRYCRQNPGSSFVPMVVTGHETSVNWACRGTQPVVINAGAVDSQGYARSNWRRISP